MGRTTVEQVPVRTLRMRVSELGIDVAIGLFWAALIVAIVLFSGIASQFAYVDF